MTSSLPAGSSSSGLSEVRRFGAFELDLLTGELRKAGAAVRLQPQPAKVLALLVERAGQLVTREDLKRAIWGEDTYVDFERGLNFCVAQVRAALEDTAEAPRFVQTLPRRGYRFIAPVHPGSDGSQTGVGPGSNRGQSQAAERLRVPGRTAADRQIMTAGVAILAIAALGALISTLRVPARVGPAPTRTMVAVLPLDDLTGDEGPSWFADGLTEEIIAQLGRTRPDRLGVIARTSVMAYRGTGKSVAEIGRELGVTHVLEGSIRREANRLRITLQLVAASDQARVWSETFDRTVHGALTIQSDVAANVVRALALELVPDAAPAATAATHSPAARDAYLRGRYLWIRGDFRSALEQFDEALGLDPRYAVAHAAKADTYHRLSITGQARPRESYARAAEAAAEALRLDAHLAEAHAAQGIVRLWADWNPAAAVESFERALSLNASDAAAHHDLAWALVSLGRFDDAIVHISRARDLDPLSPRASSDIGWLHLHLRQPSEAIRACRQTLALDRESIEAQQCLERAHVQKGEIIEALAAARAAAERSRTALPAALAAEGPPDARLRALWQWRLERLQRAAAERYVSPYTIATHHAMLGDGERALERLEEAHAERTATMVLLPGDPVFEFLRADPRFQKLVAKVRAR